MRWRAGRRPPRAHSEGWPTTRSPCPTPTARRWAARRRDLRAERGERTSVRRAVLGDGDQRDPLVPSRRCRAKFSVRPGNQRVSGIGSAVRPARRAAELDPGEVRPLTRTDPARRRTTARARRSPPRDPHRDPGGTPRSAPRWCRRRCRVEAPDHLARPRRPDRRSRHPDRSAARGAGARSRRRDGMRSDEHERDSRTRSVRFDQAWLVARWTATSPA